MNTDQLQFIADEFPVADREFPPRIASIVENYNDLRDRAIRMEAALLRVARLNPDAGEIGAGMLRTIVSEARNALS